MHFSLKLLWILIIIFRYPEWFILLISTSSSRLREGVWIVIVAYDIVLRVSPPVSSSYFGPLYSEDWVIFGPFGEFPHDMPQREETLFSFHLKEFHPQDLIPLWCYQSLHFQIPRVIPQKMGFWLLVYLFQGIFLEHHYRLVGDNVSDNLLDLIKSKRGGTDIPKLNRRRIGGCRYGVLNTRVRVTRRKSLQKLVCRGRARMSEEEKRWR